jgi:hypothetical protein
VARCHAAETESTKLQERTKHLSATIDSSTAEIRRLMGENTSLAERLRAVSAFNLCAHFGRGLGEPPHFAEAVFVSRAYLVDCVEEHACA